MPLLAAASSISPAPAKAGSRRCSETTNSARDRRGLPAKT
jgi:hypothetical protein